MPCPQETILCDRGSLALFNAGQNKSRGFALGVSRLLCLGSTQGTIFEHVSKRAGSLSLAKEYRLVAANAVHASAGLLARARSVRADSSPTAASRGARAGAFLFASQAAGAASPRIRVVVGDWRARIFSSFRHGAHATCGTTRTLAALQAGSDQVVHSGPTGTSSKVLASFMLGSRLRLELVQRRGSSWLPNRMLASASLTWTIASRQWCQRERSRLWAGRFGGITRCAQCSQSAIDGRKRRGLLMATTEGVGGRRR